jgi:hypothetical protein
MTICTKDKRLFFGIIVDGAVQLSGIRIECLSYLEGVGSTYEIKLADNPDFAEPLVRDSTTSTGYTLETSLAGGRYYWRVRVLQTDIPSD